MTWKVRAERPFRGRVVAVEATHEERVDAILAAFLTWVRDRLPGWPIQLHVGDGKVLQVIHNPVVPPEARDARDRQDRGLVRLITLETSHRPR